MRRFFVVIYTIDMCGRFTITVDWVTIRERFGATLPLPEFQPHYNASPGQLLPVIINTTPDQVTLAVWGYLPTWSKDGAQKTLINARAETINDKYVF